MSDPIWYYDKNGRSAFYRVDDDVYRDGRRIYWVSDGNWYSNEFGHVERVFYESGEWLFNNAGSNEYYRA